MFASSLVTKQTELKREKRRSDRLLCQMLPKAVARQLKQRKQVRRCSRSAQMFVKQIEGKSCHSRHTHLEETVDYFGKF